MVKKEKSLVGIIMGSQSDWETMQHAAKQLEDLKVPFEAQVISAHRAPDRLFEYASSAADRGLEIIIAAAESKKRDVLAFASIKVSPLRGDDFQEPSGNATMRRK